MSNMAEQTAERHTGMVQTNFPDIEDDSPKCGSCCAANDHGPVLCLCGSTAHDGPLGDQCPAFVATYNAPQIVHLTGATYRQLDYWTTTGRLQPVIEARGSGTVRRYLGAELDTARLVLALLRFGMNLDPAFTLARQLTTEDEVSVVLADVFELTIRVRDTAPTSPQEGTTP